MKILLLAHKMPYPPRDGGSIVTLNFAKAFARLGHEVIILAMNTYKRQFDVKNIPSELKKLITFHAEYVDTKIKPFHLLVNLFSRKPYHIWRYGSSKRYAERLVEILKSGNFDIVQFEGLYLSPYLELVRKFSNAKVIMRAHNVEYEIIERYANFENSVFKKLWLKTQASRLKRYELEQLKLYDALVPISKRDAKILFCEGLPTFVAPAGIDLSEIKIINDLATEFPSLFYIGALDWFPNQQGLEWFFEEVWIELIRKVPNVKFYLAGRNPNSWGYLKRKKLKNVEILGEVEDAYRFMSSKAIMVVPLFAGSGIRVKILEAMALGKVVISTTIGAEGIDFRDGENILIADTKEKFLEQIMRCLADRRLCQTIGEKASEFVKEKYDLNKIAKNLLEFYNKIGLTGEKLG
jgi:glycosyltransferase involved in cell wall biosynthesis